MLKTDNDKAKRLVDGALILTGAGTLVKIIGVIYKIPLTNLLGDSGMGYFNSAYTIYTLFYMLSTAGLPSALSLLVCEEISSGRGSTGAKRIYRTGALLFMSLGALFTLIMALGSGYFADKIGNPAAYTSIAYASPTIFFICGVSAIRGYFQGFGYMTPTAVSQVIEALGKLVLGLVFAYIVISKGDGVQRASAFALFGLSISTAAAFVYLIISKKVFDSKRKDQKSKYSNETVTESGKSIAKKIIKTSFPITLSASVMSLANMLDLMIVMRRLASSGYSESAANALYGNYSSLAVPMFNMPTVLIVPIAYSIAPFIRSHLVSGDTELSKLYCMRAVKITSLIAFPASLGICVLSKPILSLIYTNADSVDMASGLLKLLAPAIVFLAFLTVTNAILQAYGNIYKPIISMCAGAFVKIVSEYILIGKIGIAGTPISTYLCYVTACTLNMAFLMKALGEKISIKDVFIMPMVSSVLCALTASVSNKALCMYINDKTASLMSIALGAAVYLLILILTGEVKDEMKSIKIPHMERKRVKNGYERISKENT